MRRLDNIDLRLLRVFVTLVEAGGFADAQVALNLSASTLSTHLAALERKLGGRLCERGRGGFRLTPFGEADLQGGEAALRATSTPSTSGSASSTASWSAGCGSASSTAS